MIRIHNSLTGEKRVLEPIRPGRVGMYVCGLTVYDYMHIGHARMLTVFDVVSRYLRYRGYELQYVRNITDIDDKIIKRAAENEEPIDALTERFIRAMNEDAALLGLARPDSEPRATQYVPQIIEMIAQLIGRGYAYVADDGDVLYAVAKFEGYGKLSGKRLQDLRAGARVEVDEAKRDPLDFVLWKHAKPGEPSWASPWGAGRPGWHIECSAMSTALLGRHFDIHGGGMDLKFPHHENEIAQSCGAHGGQFVNLWMHNGFVNIDNEKMSKSLGNFFTVREILPKLRHPEVLRYFILSSHYRGPINYSWDQLAQADSALTRIYTALRDLPHSGRSASEGRPAAGGSAAGGSAASGSAAGGSAASGSSAGGSAASGSAATGSAHSARFREVMDDDFNTPEAIAVLQTMTREINSAKAAGEGARAAALGAELRSLGEPLGLVRVDPDEWAKLGVGVMGHGGGDALGRAAAGAGAALSDDDIERQIAERLTARKAKNWAESDRIRDELAKAGIVLEDKPGGSTSWRRA
jgi:cysteinyl-tRNA synthetase